MARPNAADRVARVAAKGKATSADKRSNWIFPASIVAILALGIGIIGFARGKTETATGNTEHPIAQLTADQQVFDHWHAAFSVYVCGVEQPPVSDVKADINGVHTHSDGLVHIHPFNLQASGKRATMSRFFDQTGIEVSGDTITLPYEVQGGRSFTSGKDTCGGEPAEWVLAHWKEAQSANQKAKPDEVVTEDFGSVRFSENWGAYTLAFVPLDEVDSIPVPSTAADIEALGAVDGGSVPSDAPQPGATDPEPATETTIADVGGEDAPETTVASADDSEDAPAEEAPADDAGGAP